VPIEITTAEQLLRAQDLGPCELIRGTLRTLTYNDVGHGQAAAHLGAAIADHVHALRLGAVCVSTGFVLARNPDTVRAADIAFLGADRVDLGPGYVEGAPDLAVEVLSHDDRPGYVREKITDWLKAGAHAVWVADPHERTVTIHEPRRKPKHLAETEILRGGGMLPGFETPVASIFA
jgi:Uma2 family endonuclease